MKFNKLIRGNKREANTKEDLYATLDAGFMCTIAVNHNGIPMQLPTTYGRKGNILYTHGSAKNFVLNQAIEQEQVSVSVSHLDGIVLAKTLFNTSANYRSAILFGKMTLVEDEAERMEGLEIITENIIPNRWNEVKIGNENELKATMVTKFTIESATVKIRNGGPNGDEAEESRVWSGHIPLKMVAQTPVFDAKIEKELSHSQSVELFLQKFS